MIKNRDTKREMVKFNEGAMYRYPVCHRHIVGEIERARGCGKCHRQRQCMPRRLCIDNARDECGYGNKVSG